MASDLNSGLSKKTNVFGLKAWVLMVIVVGLFIIIILVVLSICLALRKKSRRGKGGMLPLGHILSISEEIKEISVDQVSSNNHPQNGSFMSLNDKFSDGDSRKVLIQTKNGDNSSQSGSFNRLEKDLNGSQSGDDNGGFRSISAYRSSSHPISASSPCSGLPEFSHLGWGHWFALRDLELTLLLEKVVMELSIEVNLSTGTLWPLRNSSIICISEEEKKRLLHCIVIGGGPTGVEFSGELSDFITRDVRERYTHVKDYIHVTLIEENEILSSFDVGLQQYATKLLTKSGVCLMRGVVKEVHPQKIILSDRTEVPYGLLVWSTGIGPSEFVKKLNLPSSPGGRIGVDGWMRVQSVKDVFALGDCAGFLEQTGRPVLPALAKVKFLNLWCNSRNTC